MTSSYQKKCRLERGERRILRNECSLDVRVVRGRRERERARAERERERERIPIRPRIQDDDRTDSSVNTYLFRKTSLDRILVQNT